jgi:hypothetical protein
LGKSVTSDAGLFTYRWVLIILPILPVLLLVIQNAVGLDDLLFKRLRVVENERRVHYFVLHIKNCVYNIITAGLVSLMWMKIGSNDIAVQCQEF